MSTNQESSKVVNFDFFTSYMEEKKKLKEQNKVKEELREVREVVKLLTACSSIILTVGVFVVVVKMLVGGKFFVDFTEYLLAYGNQFGVWFGGASVLLMTMLVVTVSALVAFKFGLLSRVIWKKLVNTENKEEYKLCGIFALGLFFGLAIVLVL